MPGKYSQQSTCPAFPEVYASWIVVQLAYNEVHQHIPAELYLFDGFYVELMKIPGLVPNRWRFCIVWAMNAASLWSDVVPEKDSIKSSINDIAISPGVAKSNFIRNE